MVQVIKNFELSRVFVTTIQVELLKQCTNFYHQFFFKEKVFYMFPHKMDLFFTSGSCGLWLMDSWLEDGFVAFIKKQKTKKQCKYKVLRVLFWIILIINTPRVWNLFWSYASVIINNLLKGDLSRMKSIWNVPYECPINFVCNEWRLM